MFRFAEPSVNQTPVQLGCCHSRFARDWSRGIAGSIGRLGRERAEHTNLWQNPFNESFGGMSRREILECELFGSGLEAKVLCEVYRWWYNNHREHGMIGSMTPVGYGEMVTWTERVQPSPAMGL